jgi:hypothetical protein
MAIAGLFVVVFFLFLLAPTEAFAWGPVTHLQIGLEALRNLELFNHSLRMLLQSFPYDYLYGCIAADIIFAKRLAGLHEHSHNWSVAHAVLEEASSPPQEAFAHGYLSHLAADTIAHNYFVPECTVKNYSARRFRHLYWEVRFDTLAKTELWDLSREIVQLPQHEEDDALLEKVVKRTLFSFKTDKRIFNSLLVLNRMDQWRRMLNTLSRNSPWKFSVQDVSRYRTLSSGATLDFLIQSDRAACLRMDPIGSQALLSARWIRRNLRALERKGKLEPGLYQQALLSLGPTDRLSPGLGPDSHAAN